MAIKGNRDLVNDLGGKQVVQTDPEVRSRILCSTQLNMFFFMPIYVNMPTTVGILTFMSGKNTILGLPEPEKC